MPTTQSEHASLAAALVAFQASLPRVEKDATNPAFKSKYATYDAVASTVLPLLAAQGVAFNCTIGMDDGVYVLTARIIHAKSGDMESFEWPLPDPSKVSPQQIRSATTYGKRTALELLTGVPTGDDVDGNDVPPAEAKRSARQPRERQQPAKDYLAIAKMASTVDTVRTVWEEAREAGAGQELLDAIRAVAADLPAEVDPAAGPIAAHEAEIAGVEA